MKHSLSILLNKVWLWYKWFWVAEPFQTLKIFFEKNPCCNLLDAFFGKTSRTFEKNSYWKLWKLDVPATALRNNKINTTDYWLLNTATELLTTIFLASFIFSTTPWKFNSVRTGGFFNCSSISRIFIRNSISSLKTGSCVVPKILINSRICPNSNNKIFF